ncbi:Hypothetical predicted protein [Pelobates cultripes]|uniref:Uncharacterized protein n=1 Tax=Pelobates cultripes TaxID=61616 RepID=A0AAD1R473_PELCU|nr:Hypothetical predicted protein [Pelobates cultripes]
MAYPSGSSSEEEPLDTPDPIPEAEHHNLSVHTSDMETPSTKGYIMSLLEHTQNIFRADLDILREEQTAITDWINATKEDVSSLTQHQQGTVKKSRALRPHTRLCRSDWMPWMMRDGATILDLEGSMKQSQTVNCHTSPDEYSQLSFPLSRLKLVQEK